MKFLFLSFLSVFFVISKTLGQSSATNTVPQPTWGRIIPATNSTGIIRLEVRTWPADGKLPLHTPFPNFTAAHLLDGLKREPLNWIFNDDATRLHLEVPAQAPATLPPTIALETAEKTGQFIDGRIVFSALDASVQGNKAKLESNPGNYRIGFWTDPADSVSWDFKPTRWGMYDLELSFSADGGDGTELQFDVAGQTFHVTRPSTGSWYRYRTLSIGRFYLARAEPFTLRASCGALKGSAVMNLKAVMLRPAPEGKAITQEASGALTLLARDATTHSVMLRYEPATNKNCSAIGSIRTIGRSGNSALHNRAPSSSRSGRAAAKDTEEVTRSSKSAAGNLTLSSRKPATFKISCRAGSGT